MVRTWGRIPLGQFLISELNIQYPVKSFAPYLGGRRGRVPSDSLRNSYKRLTCIICSTFFDSDHDFSIISSDDNDDYDD